jgi:hypothetical protein
MTDVPTYQDVLLALLSLDAYSRGNLPQLRYKDSDLPDQVGTEFADTRAY